MHELSVITIDCEYGGPEMAAAFLVLEDNAAAFVDNNTARAVPILLQSLEKAGLTPGHVQYLIVTHVHLDHAGGTSALLRECPNAQVLCHALAERHLINPARLVQSSRLVYGEPVFTQLYGIIEPIDSHRVRVVRHGETIALGGRTLTFLDTPGHARHHLSVFDSASRTAFTGDVFGLHYPWLQRGTRPFIMASSPPTDFDAEAATASVNAIMSYQPERIGVTHYGSVSDPPAAQEVLLRSIGDMEAVCQKAAQSSHPDEALRGLCEDWVREAMYELAVWCGVDLTPHEKAAIEKDILINAQGLALKAVKRRNSNRT
ncbi:MAG: MBL fold metallo-hydrolase [Candidatus Hydrogenedentota bacterium]